jgi:hypothetical protein
MSGEPLRGHGPPTINNYGNLNYNESGTFNSGGERAAGDIGYPQRLMTGWQQFGYEHPLRRKIVTGCVVLCTAVAVLTLGGCLSHGSTPSSSSGGTGTPGGTQVTPDSGNQSGLGPAQTTPEAPPPPSGLPPDFVPQPHQDVVGGSSSDSYTAEYQNASSTAAYDVYVEFKENNGQLARFDSSGAVMCDPQATYTPTFAERTAIFCPEVPAGAEIDFTPAVWDNPSAGHIHIYFSANRGQGPTTGPDTGDPPKGSPQILVDTVDIALGVGG